MTDVSANEGVPRAGVVVSVVVSLASISLLSIFLTQKYATIKSWRVLPCAMWLVIGVYMDSYLFVFVTAILKFGLGLNSSSVCDGAIYLCLVCYISSKLIYMFLVEKAYIIRGALVRRLKSKLWCFNTFGMLGGYGVVIVLNFVYRISHLDDEGNCVIGMERRALLPLILFDLVLNVYLTSLFLIPLFSLYSFQNRKWTRPTTKLHKMAVRTFIGSLATLTSVIVNLSVLTALNGEPGWVCLLCCNTDVLWSAVMVHWLTYHDHVGSRTHNHNHNNNNNNNSNGGNTPDNGSHRSANNNRNGLSHSNASSGHNHNNGRCSKCPYSAYGAHMFARHHHRRGGGAEEEDVEIGMFCEQQQPQPQPQQQYRGIFITTTEDNDVERAGGAATAADEGWQRQPYRESHEQQRKRNSRFSEAEVALPPSGEQCSHENNNHNTIRVRSMSTSTSTSTRSTKSTMTTTTTGGDRSAPASITSPEWNDHDHEASSPAYRRELIMTTTTSSPTIVPDDRTPQYSNALADRHTRPAAVEGGPRPLPPVCRRTSMSLGI